VSTIRERATHAVGLKFFEDGAWPEPVGVMNLRPPREEQHVLRMLILKPTFNWAIPESLEWVWPMIKESELHQSGIARHPFAYITVRNGYVKSTGDDEWHVDGFSTRFTHVPEQNYIWTSGRTEFCPKGIKFPRDFDPDKHNVHKYIQRRMDEGVAGMPNFIYAIDPYVVHRRALDPTPQWRTFVRVTFCPIEIDDVNNTINPGMPTDYGRDGVKQFRDLLEDYDERQASRPQIVRVDPAPAELSARPG
jgi:hypothetical protein